MQNPFSRTALQLGDDKLERLRRARVAVFGLGGVGGHCAEALCRSGVGGIDLYDHDRICTTNLNRQLIATASTVGQRKVEAMRVRLLDINPDAEVGAFPIFYTPETADGVDLTRYDYVVDAVDTITAKLELATRATALGVPVISAMGTANKLDPTALRVTDLARTDYCPLARIMRKELRRRGVLHLKVVASDEPAMVPKYQPEQGCGDCALCPADEVKIGSRRRQVPGSNGFVPAAAGLALAGAVIRDLLGIPPRKEGEPYEA